MKGSVPENGGPDLKNEIGSENENGGTRSKNGGSDLKTKMEVSSVEEEFTAEVIQENDGYGP
ncbi:hypothetical protein U1Q18_012411, partial [Sarracenia purpurea var. burkii]